MLRSLKGALHKILSGAANKVAPSQESSVALMDPELGIEDLIRYPPETKGIPVITLEKIVSSQFEIIRLTHRDSGLPDPFENNQEAALKPRPASQKKGSGKVDDLVLNFDTLFRQVMVNYIRYIHLLPASENHHHSDVGGLVRHSLEVALNSLRKAQQQVLPAVGHLDDEQARKPRWQYAAWVCGLLHDAGKILYDMRVYDVDTGKDWNPYLSDMLTWAAENKVKRYRVTWRPEHRHKKHENLSVQVLEWVLTKEAKSFLMDNSDELPIAINHALAHYGSQDGYLQTCLREADSSSTEKDIRTQWHEMIGKRRYPLESALVTAMRRLRDNWEVNKPKGHVWVVGDEVYLSWPKTIQLVVQRLQEDKVDVPVNPTRVLEILEERNLVVRLDEGVTYSMFTPTDMEGVSGPERVIRLAWPGLLYETMPVPRSVPGTLRLNNEGKTLQFLKDGSVIESAGDVESSASKEGSESSRRANAQMKALGSETASNASGKAPLSGSGESKPQMSPPAKAKPIAKSEGKVTRKKSKAEEKSDEPDIQMPAIPKPQERPIPAKTSKGLNFANQGAHLSGVPNASKPKSESKLQTDGGNNVVCEAVVEQMQPFEDMDEPISPKQAAMMMDSIDLEPPAETIVPAAKKPVVAIQTEEPLPKNDDGHAQAGMENRKQGGISAGPAIGGGLRKRKTQQGQIKLQQPKKGWLGQRKAGKSQADALLVDFAEGVANGKISVEPGQGVYLVGGQFHIDVKFVAQLLNIEAGPAATAFKQARYLDYDKLKPNLLVQHKDFGFGPVMVISLTKVVSKQLREELGLSLETVDYSSSQVDEVAVPTQKPTEFSGGVSNKHAPQNQKAKKPDSQPPLAKGNKVKSESELDAFMSFLTGKSVEDCPYMQLTENERHWGIFVQGALLAYMEEKRSGANRNALSREITMLAQGVVDMDTPTGKKKHLLIPREMIG